MEWRTNWMEVPLHKGKVIRPITVSFSGGDLIVANANNTIERTNRMETIITAAKVKSGAWVGSVADHSRHSGLYGLPELAFEKYEDFERAVMREVRAKLRAAHAAAEVKPK